MTIGLDNYRLKKNEIYRLYISGLEPGDIAGRTGVPAFRIQREMDLLTQRDPALLSLHLAGKVRSNRKGMRWPKARFVISADEVCRSRDEY